MPLSRDLRTLLFGRAEEVLEDHQGLGHVESDNEQESVTLTFPRQTEGGFDVIVEATPKEIILFANGAHVQFDRSLDEVNQEGQGEVSAGSSQPCYAYGREVRGRQAISLVHRVPRRHAVACGARDRFAFLELFRSPL